MRQFSAALLSRAMGTVKDLFAPPCGRHSTVGGRRRRSTRVRRYAPLPDAPAQLSAVPEHPALPDVPAPRPRTEPRTTPRPRLRREPASTPAQPHRRFPADDIALVRPYYEARERELDRIQAEAAARLRGWTTKGTGAPSSGDLLAPVPAPGPVPVPAPRTPEPPGERDELERLTRVWITQQERRQEQRQRQAVPA